MTHDPDLCGDVFGCGKSNAMVIDLSCRLKRRFVTNCAFLSRHQEDDDESDEAGEDEDDEE